MLDNGYEWWFRNSKREWNAAFFCEFLKEKVSLNEGVAEFQGCEQVRAINKNKLVFQHQLPFSQCSIVSLGQWVKISEQMY